MTTGDSHIDSPSQHRLSRQIKASPAALREALRDRVTNHHRFLLQLHVQHIDALDAALNAIDLC